MLIAFEGLDQSGKETQARRLRSRIEQSGQRVRAVSFPAYETPIGKELAAALAGGREFPPDVMQLLYVANRCEAYGEAHGLDPAWLGDIQRLLPPATVTIFLDIAPDTAVARKATGRDRYERDLALLARVRESYRRQAREQGWVVINGEEAKDQVAESIELSILPRLALR
jgi:dTMP kinase